MRFNTTEIIEGLEDEATSFSELGEPRAEELSARYQFTANTLRKFREILIRIANCQGGIPSFQATEVLEETGHCSHKHAVYKGSCTKGHWHCPDCNDTSPDMMVSFRRQGES